MLGLGGGVPGVDAGWPWGPFEVRGKTADGLSLRVKVHIGDPRNERAGVVPFSCHEDVL
jgi:hypothetical protein